MSSAPIPPTPGNPTAPGATPAGPTAPASRIGAPILALAAAVLVLAVALAYVLGGGGGAAVAAPTPATPLTPAAASDSLAGQARTLTMTGRGEATVVPDQVRFDVAVSLVRDDLATALDAAGSRLQQVTNAVRRAGVQRSDVQTAGLDMDPEYDYAGRTPRLVGYRVTQRATVLVRELRRGGRAVTEAVAAGGDAVRVSGLRLQVSDPSAAQERARRAAVADATAKAEQYAAATGQGLGRVLTLREASAAAPRAVVPQASYALDRLAFARDVDLQIRAGKDDVAVRVEVVWEFGAASQ
ncbi:SIMPL domain-containing protein [Nocardioides sp. TRM66260-LWL]|uniref:SIMPL domain-containing protein n=1 Tax=Nocardioides sp. TRM66260-LWL TaxID=2874478 RepID=UPI001CC4EB82|nr:SIMPL domain-containing protein [Nocardioides sp. TRM66260-LWL]MBZ5733834.1 SIMPL domain-containing protein [Nocardioides sp. TRM66260-LWL]